MTCPLPHKLDIFLERLDSKTSFSYIYQNIKEVHKELTGKHREDCEKCKSSVSKTSDPSTSQGDKASGPNMSQGDKTSGPSTSQGDNASGPIMSQGDKTSGPSTSQGEKIKQLVSF